MAKQSKSTLGTDPLDALIPAEQALESESESSKTEKQRVTFQLSKDVIERARNAVYWTPGLTMSGLAEEALKRELKRLEEKRGMPFSERAQELKAGRPVKQD